MSFPHAYRVRYDSARTELTAAVRRQFPTAVAVQYGRCDKPDDTILWKVLGPGETVLWDGTEGNHDIPAWEGLGEAVDALGDAAREALNHRLSMSWVDRTLDDAHAERIPGFDVSGILAAAAFGDELTMALAHRDDMGACGYSVGAA